MRNITYAESESYPVAILIKNTSFNKYEIQANYVNALLASGVVLSDIVAFNLKYEPTGKVSVKFMKEYLESLLEAMDSVGVKWLYVADANYFKVLTKQTKAEQHLGYVLPCTVAGYEHMNVVLGLNYQALIYNPELKDKLNLSLKTLSDAIAGNYVAIGSGIIHSAWYPEGTQEIREALQSLHQYPMLACDIETTSLRFWEADLETISFAWGPHDGMAFCIGRDNSNEQKEVICSMLKEFFELYNKPIIWHNVAYDAKVLTYRLWMRDLLDTEGLLRGLGVMTKNFHDTKLIAYLATNSTAGNKLGLKDLAHEFAGDYGVF